MTTDTVAKTAAKIRKKYKTRNPFDICNDTGIYYDYKDLGGLKGLLVYYRGIYLLGINESLGERLSESICAHELGHYFLHGDLVKTQSFSEYIVYQNTNRFEFEANMFSAELLIDDSEILELFRGGYTAEQASHALGRDINLVGLKVECLRQRGYALRGLDIKSDFLK
ncbi:MAG: ImmA/IrrE family metallo-endopeptidase [Clostridia bacterium]|nr:ImmA/IrrE family metallo-endopeptidase [Clostridia bacterium]